MTKNVLFQRDIISMQDIELEAVLQVLALAKKIKQNPLPPLLQNKIVASCFFEPSTRTRLSFESAALRLGANLIGFSSAESLSVQKGETLSDTMRVIAAYADLIVIRHPREGSACLAADVAECPVINAGDGANQHPTQALTDLFTIQEIHPHLNNLSIALAGDLKYGRTIHSFIEVCSLFDVRLYLVSPEALALPEVLCDKLKQRGVRFSFHRTVEEVIANVDVLYMTRIQQERLSETEYQLVKDQFVLTPASLKNARSHLQVLHPLPRVNEISIELDETPYAYYFKQAKNGSIVRQALLTLILQESLP